MYFVKGIIAIYNGIIKFFRYFFIGLCNTIIIIPKYFIIGIRTILGKKEKNKTSKQSKKLSIIILCLSILVYLISVFLISKWSVQQLKVKYLSQDIIESTKEIEKEEGTTSGDSGNKSAGNSYWSYDYIGNSDFADLLKKNPDTVGWIKVDGTRVDYPIVQADDNDYYLNHDFKKRKNIAGWIFADYRVNFNEFEKNTIIYGHNMNNKTMFGSIPNMLYDGYLSNSSKYSIKISTPNSDSTWKVFSIYTINPEVYYLKTNFDSVPFDTWVKNVKSRSIHNFGIDVDKNDYVLTLSTCDNTGTKRVAVHAKLVDIKYK